MKKRELYNYLKTIVEANSNYKIPAIKNFEFWYETFEGFTIANNEDISFKLVFDKYKNLFHLKIVDETIYKNRIFIIEKEFNIEDFEI